MSYNLFILFTNSKQYRKSMCYYNKMTNLTILGCCRQHSLKYIYNVNNIIEGINYCHYSKEVLQLIQYLKYKNIDPEYTRYLFRSYILANYSCILDGPIYEDYKHQFETSDMVVIEIATRQAYKWHQKDVDYYLHEITHEEKYGFYDRSNIQVYQQSDEEIEADLIQIKNELMGKKFIIVSHLCTYEKGKRWELVCLLEKLCAKHSIPFFNQTLMIYKYGKGILINEPVYAHYNEIGHQLVGQELKKRIDRLIDPRSKPLYTIYHSSKTQNESDGIYGYGDFIRGAIYLQQANEKYADGKFDIKPIFPQHILNQCLVSYDYLDIDICENRKCVKLYEDWVNEFDYTYVFTNKFYRDVNISQQTKALIKERCFTPRFHISEKINNLKQKYGLINYAYSVIHVRLNDLNSDKTHENAGKYNTIMRHIIDIVQPGMTYLLLCSDPDYFNRFEIPGIVKTGLRGGHLGLYDCTYQEAEDTVIELLLMTTCTKIYQISVHSWGSGFSDAMNRVFDVPIEHISL